MDFGKPVLDKKSAIPGRVIMARDVRKQLRWVPGSGGLARDAAHWKFRGRGGPGERGVKRTHPCVGGFRAESLHFYV